MQSCVSECCMTVRKATEPRRGVLESHVSPCDQKIHSRAHRLVRVRVRRHWIIVSVELVCRMIGSDADVILLAGLQRARAEFVEARVVLRRLNLVHELPVAVRDNILLASGVFAQAEDIDIQRHIAIHNVQDKISQSRSGLRCK